MQAELVADMGPEEMLAFTRWTLRAATPAEHAVLLAQARASLPAQALAVLMEH